MSVWEEVKKVDFTGESTENFTKAINLIVRTHNADLWKRDERFLKKKEGGEREEAKVTTKWKMQWERGVPS